MEKKITYSYDSQANQLNVFVDGKLRGGFIGNIADNRFTELLDSGAEIKLTNMNTESNHKAKVRRLRGLWIKQGIDQYRDAIMEPYEVTSTKDLTDDQLDELIARFSREQHDPADDTIRHLRSDVLTLLTRLRVYTTPGDWTQVNTYLMNPRIAGKLLYQMNVAELKQLKTKLWSILSKKEECGKEFERLIASN